MRRFLFTALIALATLAYASLAQAQTTPAATSNTPYTPVALSCSINTACPEGQGWGSEIQAVVNVRRGSATCTGVLVNNTLQDQKPYIITAHHCGTPTVGQTVNWSFEFNYQSATCADPAETPIPQVLTGAIVRVADQAGDIVMLELLDPIPATYNVFFAGWSIEALPPLNGTTISHPRGDIKKITLDDQPVIDAGDYWLAQFDHGTIEAASSGAPLFNQNNQVVGLVRSALSIDFNACSGTDGDDNAASIYFPKLSYVWDLGDPGARLSDYLDPPGSSTTVNALSGPSAIWINEINATGSGPESDEFIEVVGPPGTNLGAYTLDVYSCSNGISLLDATHTIGSFTIPADYPEYGLFILAGSSVPNADQLFTGSGSQVLPDGAGVVVLKDASGTAIFDYLYDDDVSGQPVACPSNRTLRSAGDLGGDITMGFTTDTNPLMSTAGTASLVASPGFANLDGGQNLPVELTSFNALLTGSAVELRWTTASETNNAGFEIQQGEASGWQPLGWIDGFGTTETVQSYSYHIAKLAPGAHTFRLKQIDYDGTFEYSPKVEVFVDMASSFLVEQAYPNPFNETTQFSVAVRRPQHVRVALYDVQGRQVRLLYNESMAAGQIQTLHIGSTSLPSGVYLIRIRGDYFTDTQQVLHLQ